MSIGFVRQNNPRRLPLRTFTELCAELGVTKGVMVNLLRRPGAPEACMRHHSSAAQNTYYEPRAFRAWFATLGVSQAHA